MEQQSPVVGTAAPVLSITVLNYNYAHYLPECLDSILRQDFRDFELIVIDDCSTDNSREVIAPYLADPRVRLVAHGRNQGFVRSLIEGTEVESRGEYLSVISADDVVRSPGAFGRQVALLREHADAALCFTGYERIRADGSHLAGYAFRSHDAWLPRPEALREALTGPMGRMMHSGTVIRRSAYYAAGGYSRDHRWAVDFDMWARLALYGGAVYCAGPLYQYRIHTNSMTLSVATGKAFQRELLATIGRVCREAAAMGIPAQRLRHDAVAYNLAILALDDAFSGRQQLALRRVLSAFAVAPGAAVGNRGLWIAALRALAGARLFAAARSLGRVYLPGRPTPGTSLPTR